MGRKLSDNDCYLVTGLNDGVGQLCLERLSYSRFEFLNGSALGNVYFDLARIFFHSAPQSRLTIYTIEICSTMINMNASDMVGKNELSAVRLS